MTESDGSSIYEAKQGHGPYQHQPISKQSRDIRLLSLLPGNFSDQIECIVQHASLDQEGLKYETLSYAWGSGTTRTIILIDGRPMEVTTNLGNALRYLRKEDQTIVIWADAICINQQDLAEKTQQVGMMRDIYTKCSRVYIWLGCNGDVDSESDSDCRLQDSDPFRFFQHFADGKHLYDLPGLRYNFEKEKYVFEGGGDDSFQPEGLIWDGLHKIVQSSWWSRVWTVQEAALPPEHLVVYDQWKSPWSTLDSVTTEVDRHNWSCCKQAYDALPVHLRNLIRQSRFQFFNIRDARSYVGCDRLLFYELTHSFIGQLATDPRDKVFGLLGLANPTLYQSSPADYSLSPNKVYEGIFRIMIGEANGSLFCFLGSWFSSPVRNTHTVQISSLPSWVPNFATVSSQKICATEINRITQYEYYSASCVTESQLSFGSDLALHITGHPVGIVERISNLPWDESTPSRRALFRQWLGDMESGGLNRKAFCQTLLGSLSYNLAPNVDPNRSNARWSRISAGDISSFDNWITKWGKDLSLRQEVALSLETASFGRYFFTTIEGTMGLCPLSTKPGDEVWIFNGGRVPFMVRPFGGDDEGCYRFIGDCYVDGVMFGESAEDLIYQRKIVIK